MTAWRPGNLQRIGLVSAWLAFFVLAYAPAAAPPNAINFASLMIFWSFYCCTLIILCDASRKALEGRSLLDEVTAGGAAFWRFVLVGAVSGLLLDGIAQWLGKLWIYPYWNEAVYGSTFVLGFCAYWLCISESYLAVRAILRRNSPYRLSLPCGPTRTSGIIGAIGAVSAGSGVILSLSDYAPHGYIFDINTVSPVRVHFSYFLLAFAGVWMVLEFLASARGRVSLLRSLASGNRIPLYAMLIASTAFGAFMETTNAAHHFWRYTNWPWQHTLLWGVPVSVLIAWPLQYVVFLSVYAVIGGADAADIWT